MTSPQNAQSKPPKQTFTQNDIDALVPQLLEAYPSDFPSELTNDVFPFWLCWKPTPNYSPPKTTKILKKPVRDDWQNIENLVPFSVVHDIIYTKGKPFGYGFTYHEAHPFICIDIDLATEDNHKLLEQLNSYTEWSPSSKGLHTIIRVPTLNDKQTLIQHFGNGKRNKTEYRDLFIATGYVTVTGRQLPITQSDIRIHSVDDLIDILKPYFKSNISSLPSRHQQAKQNQEELVETVKQKSVPQNKPRPSTAKQLTVAQVKGLLSQVPVVHLTDDIFDKLHNNEMCVLDPECDEEARQPWLIIGQAIHHNFQGRMEGYYLWDSWSQEGNKYDESACAATWESFTKEPPQRPVTIAALIKLVKAQHPQFPDMTPKGALKGTFANFKTYVDFYKFEVFHNEITKDLQVEPSGAVRKKWDVTSLADGQRLALSEIAEFIKSDFIQLNFSPSTYSALTIKKFLSAIGKSTTRNPIREYFIECGEKYDGQDYIGDLMETIHVSPINQHYHPAYQMFLRKWLIQVLAAACHPASRPVRLNRVLIFSGPQSIGKTRWVESLFPGRLRKYCAADKEIRISNFRSDNVKQTMELSNTLICNVNEIDRLFRSNNFADFKAFLDQTTDKIVLPYGDAVTEITRRTVFIGSTNQSAFLRDVTGNRRIEIIHCTKLDYRHSVDIDKLWGQVYHIYKEGEKWWLNEMDPVESRVIEMRDRINAGSMYIGNDSLLETLEEVFDTERTGEEEIQWLTFKQIRQICGLNNMTTNSQAFNHAKRAVLLWSIQVSGHEPRNGTGMRPRVYYAVPPVRNEAMPDLTDDTPVKVKSQDEMDLLAEMNKLQKKLDEFRRAKELKQNNDEEVV